jgi:hypothetical protein
LIEALNQQFMIEYFSDTGLEGRNEEWRKRTFEVRSLIVDTDMLTVS